MRREGLNGRIDMHAQRSRVNWMADIDDSHLLLPPAFLALQAMRSRERVRRATNKWIETLNNFTASSSSLLLNPKHNQPHSLYVTRERMEAL